MNNLAGKRWEELVVEMFKKRTHELQRLGELLHEVTELVDGGCELADMEDYVLHIDKNIHIPTWNKYPETNPSMLTLPTIESKYLVFIHPDFIFEAIWRESAFYTFMERDDGEGWGIETGVSFWIPLTYPIPY